MEVLASDDPWDELYNKEHLTWSYHKDVPIYLSKEGIYINNMLYNKITAKEKNGFRKRCPKLFEAIDNPNMISLS